jgi:hypothetical protein
MIGARTPRIYRTPGEHANLYTTDAVSKNWKLKTF